MSHKPPTLHDSVHYEHELEEHDSWFRHTEIEPHHQSAHGETKTGLLLVFLGVTIVLVFGTAYAIYMFFVMETQKLKAEMRERRTPVAEVTSARTEWEHQLSSYEWVDAAAGKVSIPLELSKKRLIEDYARRQHAK